MHQAIDQFRSNIERVRALGALHDALKKQITVVMDLSDLLRAELVLAVSALDQFVHEVVRIGMLEVHRGARPPTDAFLRFGVSMENVRKANSNPGTEDWLEDEIRDRHRWQSFQSPDKIADALRLVTDLRMWEIIAAKVGETPTDLKNRLSLVIDRRNKIAHEADIDPTFGRRWPIDPILVGDSVNFVERLAESIYAFL